MTKITQAVVSGETPPRSLAPNAVHLVRTQVLATLQLSQMADQKASILMGANFLVFTLAVGQLRAGGFVLPLIVLALFAFAAAVLSILAVLPKVRRTTSVGPDDNILFFGVFTALSEREFADRVIAELGTDEAAYRLMLRDVYQNGQVLQTKKYRYLGWAYRTFLTGLVVTLVASGAEYAAGLLP